MAAHALELPTQRLAPGGVANLALGSPDHATRVSFNGVPVLVVHDGAQWHAVVGLALSQTPGSVSVVVQREGQAPTRLSLEVAPFAYDEQRLNVAPGHVDLSAPDLARYERERAHLAGVMATCSETVPAR